MERVTLEGSTTPSTYLPTGKRITVQRTTYVDKMVRKGFAKVIAVHAQDTVLATVSAGEVVSPIAGVPPVSALKAEWADFLTAQHVYSPPDATKAEMIDRWRAVEVEAGGPFDEDDTDEDDTDEDDLDG